jgi:hypothetical protein
VYPSHPYALQNQTPAIQNTTTPTDLGVDIGFEDDLAQEDLKIDWPAALGDLEEESETHIDTQVSHFAELIYKVLTWNFRDLFYIIL